MYYEINVSLNGSHFFATAKRSITSSSSLKKIYPIIAKKFPSSEGYTIIITRFEELGYGVDTKDL